MDIREQTRNVQHEFGMPTTVLCRKLEISPSAYYRWQKHDLKLSTETENKIRKYINQLSEMI